MKLYMTRRFRKAVESLKRKHNNQALAELEDVVKQIYNRTLNAQKHNHPLKNANGFKDVHISGGKLIVLYRYDVEQDELNISAELHDIVTHDALNRRDTFSASPKAEISLEDALKFIKSSTAFSPDVDETDLESWLYDLYEKIISKSLPMDYFTIESIVDEYYYFDVYLSGVQYEEMLPFNKFDSAAYTTLRRLSNILDLSEANIEHDTVSVKCDDADAYDVFIHLQLLVENS